MNALVVGASAGLGRYLAGALARRGANLVLVSSDARDIGAVAADLTIRHGIQARPVAIDLAEGNVAVERLIRFIEESPHLDAVLLPIGAALDADQLPGDADMGRRLLQINFAAPADLIDRLLPRLSKHDCTIVGFGSVAALRGRGRNVRYGAAKRALLSYFESLQVFCAGTPVRVHFYTVGYLDTLRVHSVKTPLPKANPQRFAEYVVKRLGRRSRIGFYPPYWRVLGWVLRAVPARMLQRANV